MAITAPRYWRVFAPLAGILILFGLWSGYWLWASSAARERVAAVRTALERQGVALTCGSEGHGGYPFRLSYTCSHAVVRGTDGSLASAGRIEALARAWDPGYIVFVIEAPLSFEPAHAAAWKITTAPAAGSLALRRRHVDAALVAEHLVVDSPSGATFTAKRLYIGVRLPARAVEGKALEPPSAEVAIAIDTIDLAAPGLRPVRIDALNAGARLSRLPFAGLRTANWNAAARAAAAAGTALTIDRLTASADAVDVSASGKLGITPEGLPSGRISMQFNDTRRLFSRLAAHGMIAPKAAKAAGDLMVLLTTSGAPKGKPRPIDLAFRKGSLFWGPFRIATYGPLF